MTRFSLQQTLSFLRLIERRARGLEPGDDALSRLHLETFSASPSQWLKTIAAKLAVMVVLAGLAAGLFAGGIAVMRALGIEH